MKPPPSDVCCNMCSSLFYQCQKFIHIKVVIGELLMGAPLRMVALAWVEWWWKGKNGWDGSGKRGCSRKRRR